MSRFDLLAAFHSGEQLGAHGGCNFPGWHRAYLIMWVLDIHSIVERDINAYSSKKQNKTKQKLAASHHSSTKMSSNSFAWNINSLTYTEHLQYTSYCMLIASVIFIAYLYSYNKITTLSTVYKRSEKYALISLSTILCISNTHIMR
jgi:hypothetical protein